MNDIKHTRVPNEIDRRGELEQGDKVIYAAIRRYMNKTSRECFPSLSTIATTLQCSRTKIIKAIERLVATGLLEKTNDGRKNHYRFPETEFDKKFEAFTDEFLELDIPLNIKEYYMDVQHFFRDKDKRNGKGKCGYSNAELARRTGITVPSVKKYNTYLIERGYMQEEQTELKDAAGFPVVQKIFDLDKFQQAALWAKAVTEKIVQHDDEIEELKATNAELKAENKEMRKRMDELEAVVAAGKKKEALERNKVVDCTFPMD